MNSHICDAPDDHCPTCGSCPSDGECRCETVTYYTEEGEMMTETIPARAPREPRPAIQYECDLIETRAGCRTVLEDLRQVEKDCPDLTGHPMWRVATEALAQLAVAR